jgi:hypothetical protein
MTEDNKTKLRVAHISGRYRIICTLLASIAGLSIGFGIIINLEKPELRTTDPASFEMTWELPLLRF